MAYERLENVLSAELEALNQAGISKGQETVLVGVVSRRRSVPTVRS